jgi:RNA polymerase sigma-70 factor (ECF subfamily)
LDSHEVHIHDEIVERCRRRERTAQRQIYELYSKAMFNVALRILQDREEAEDSLQESFITCFTKIDQYRSDATFGAWLKRIVINKALSRLKQTQKMHVVQDVDDQVSQESDFEEKEHSVEAIKKAVGELPEGFRAVLSLYLFEGYDHMEISQILGISVSTSKSQYNRAKKKVKEILESRHSYG